MPIITSDPMASVQGVKYLCPQPLGRGKSAFVWGLSV